MQGVLNKLNIMFCQSLCVGDYAIMCGKCNLAIACYYRFHD